jgi:8-oxo-dGTP diphosphatase
MMPDQDAVSRVAVAVDVVCFRLQPADGVPRLQVLLVRRLPPPFAWQWALPGGVLAADELLADCSRRLLREWTDLAESYLEQLHTFDALDRDPRGRALSVAYYALLRMDAPQPAAGRDVAAARWWPVRQLPAGGMLAFDHAQIIRAAHERLRGKLDYAPIAFHMLPAAFTMTQLRHVYEAIQERPYDPTNFPRAMLARFPGLALVAGQRDRSSKRPARVYRYAGPLRAPGPDGGVT